MSLVNALKSPLSAVFGLFSPGATSKLTSLETTNLEHEGQKLVSPEGAPLNEKADFRIEGMTCGACVEVSKLLPSHLSGPMISLSIIRGPLLALGLIGVSPLKAMHAVFCRSLISAILSES